LILSHFFPVTSLSACALRGESVVGICDRIMSQAQLSCGRFYPGLFHNTLLGLSLHGSHLWVPLAEGFLS
jgi:hypothetical protein